VTETQTFKRTWPDFASECEYVNPFCPGIHTPWVVTGQNGGVPICCKLSDHPLLAFDFCW
jgi:hypothetical protein